ncbi:MAG: MarR family transcriptional regulator [Novosphingobium sp.]
MSPPDAEANITDTGHLDLLIRLLKLGSLINLPMKEHVCDPVDLSATELKVIMALKGENTLAGHDLVGIMGLPPMNVSRAIAELKGRGLVEDAIDPDNRRRRPVRLSPSGELFYDSLIPALSGMAESLLGGLGKRQQRQFAATADRIIHAMALWITSHHSEMHVKG